MQQVAIQHVWIDGHRPVGPVGAENTEGIAPKLWKYGWGLLLILVMTVLSEYGPRTAYSKMSSDLHEVTQQTVHWIK